MGAVLRRHTTYSCGASNAPLRSAFLAPAGEELHLELGRLSWGAKMDRGPRVRRWCFTVNNYTDEDCELVKDMSVDKMVSFLVVGKEVGEKGTPHLQGYIELSKQVYQSSLRKWLPRATLLASRDPKGVKAAAYCEKECVWLKVGEQGGGQGTRTDLSRLRDVIEQGDSLRDMIEDGALGTHTQLKCADALLKYYEPARDWLTEVYWIVGWPRSGKDQLANALAPGAYRKHGHTEKWWDGYDGHEDVILEDLRDHHYKLEELLGMLGAHGFRIQCKGGMRQLRAKRVFITTVFRPETFYLDKGEDMSQLYGRITKVLEYQAPGYCPAL